MEGRYDCKIKQLEQVYYRTHITIGQPETVTDMMRSILAQLEYKYQNLECERKGVPFPQHVYVPEIHPVSKQVYWEMEDKPHVYILQ